MRTILRLIFASAIALSMAGLAHAATDLPQQGPAKQNPCPMADKGGPGNMGMGHGPHRGWVREKPLTDGQIRDIVQGRIAWHGEEAKVQSVTAKDDTHATVEVADASGKTIHRMLVDRTTGAFTPLP